MVEENPNNAPSTLKFAKKSEPTKVEMSKVTGVDVKIGKEEGTKDALQQATASSPSTTEPSLFAAHDQVAADAHVGALNDRKAILDSSKPCGSAFQEQTAYNISSSGDSGSFASSSVIVAANEISSENTENTANTTSPENDQPQEKGKEVENNTDKIAKEAQEVLDLFQAPQGLVSIVIPSGKNFLLHIDVLVDKCDYFRAALMGSFREAETKLLNLPDVSDNVFGFFLKWIYSGSIKPANGSRHCNMHNECNLTLPGLFELWFLADYLRAPALQNHALTNVVDKLRIFRVDSKEECLKHISASIKMLWSSKGRTDLDDTAKPLRELLLDFVANPRYMPKPSAKKLLKHAPASFLRDFALGTVSRNSVVRDLAGNLAEEHSLLGPPNDISDEVALLEYTCGGAYERIGMALVNFESLDLIMEIHPAKYFVKDVKRPQAIE
ncbi:hypothetical protein N0V82_004082 [Gnomoniopsis sp. IMI 355080]|nr:hypothetical protein N0V82_004082 [Gnomoniopsis sp. IMI 355080]